MYASIGDLVLSFGQEEVARLSSVTDSVVSWTLLEQAINGTIDPATTDLSEINALKAKDRLEFVLTKASTTIDGFLSRRYKTPVITSLGIDNLNECCCAYAWWYLYPKSEDLKSENMLNRRLKEAKGWLEQIMNGDTDLNGGELLGRAGMVVMSDRFITVEQVRNMP